MKFRSDQAVEDPYFIDLNTVGWKTAAVQSVANEPFKGILKSISCPDGFGGHCLLSLV